MQHPATNLEPFGPVARPAFGLARPFEIIFSFGQTAFIPTQFLYWGADHLLLVRRENASEQYRRIYYADIQGVQVVQNNASRYFELVVLGVALVFAGMAAMLAQSLEGEMRVVLLAVVAVLALCAGAMNWVFGPTCRCTLLTAVEAIPLPAVARLQKAARFADELGLRVAPIQGPLPTFEAGAQPPLTACQALLPNAKPALEPRYLNWHIAQVAFLAGSWLLSLLLLNYDIQDAAEYPLPGVIFSGIFFFAYVLSASIAVGRQRTMELGEALKKWTTWSLVLTCGFFFVMTMIMTITNMDPAQSGIGLPPLELRVVDLALSTILLLVGALVLREEIRRPLRQPATP